MGCWNHTCAVSNLHIRAGQDVMVFLLLKQLVIDSGSFCYANALYDVALLPFYGKYDDYGAVEECYGLGLPILVDRVRECLVERETGENKYHDISVKKDGFDIDKLFAADHEARLAVYDPIALSNMAFWKSHYERLLNEGTTQEPERVQKLLDEVNERLKSPGPEREVSHVVIHGDIYRAVLNNWSCYHRLNGKLEDLKFTELVESIPEFIRLYGESRHHGIGSYYAHDSKNLAMHWLDCLENSSCGSSRTLIDIKRTIEDYYRRDELVELAAFVEEVLRGAWINAFMSQTRRVWTPQSGQGSQSDETLGYEVLAHAVLDVLKREEEERA